jgi:hypothetical protein
MKHNIARRAAYGARLMYPPPHFTLINNIHYRFIICYLLIVLAVSRGEAGSRRVERKEGLIKNRRAARSF